MTSHKMIAGFSLLLCLFGCTSVPQFKTAAHLIPAEALFCAQINDLDGFLSKTQDFIHNSALDTSQDNLTGFIIKLIDLKQTITNEIPGWFDSGRPTALALLPSSSDQQDWQNFLITIPVKTGNIQKRKKILQHFNGLIQWQKEYIQDYLVLSSSTGIIKKLPPKEPLDLSKLIKYPADSLSIFININSIIRTTKQSREELGLTLLTALIKNRNLVSTGAINNELFNDLPLLAHICQELEHLALNLDVGSHKLSLILDADFSPDGFLHQFNLGSRPQSDTRDLVKYLPGDAVVSYALNFSSLDNLDDIPVPEYAADLLEPLLLKQGLSFNTFVRNLGPESALSYKHYIDKHVLEKLKQQYSGEELFSKAITSLDTDILGFTKNRSDLSSFYQNLGIKEIINNAINQAACQNDPDLLGLTLIKETVQLEDGVACQVYTYRPDPAKVEALLNAQPELSELEPLVTSWIEYYRLYTVIQQDGTYLTCGPSAQKIIHDYAASNSLPGQVSTNLINFPRYKFISPSFPADCQLIYRLSLADMAKLVSALMPKSQTLLEPDILIGFMGHLSWQENNLHTALILDVSEIAELMQFLISLGGILLEQEMPGINLQSDAVVDELMEQGVVLLNQQNYTQAIEVFQRALQEARTVGSRKDEAFILAYLAAAYTELNAIDEALTYYKQALEVASVLEIDILIQIVEQEIEKLSNSQ